jgi:hypothetical protein
MLPNSPNQTGTPQPAEGEYDRNHPSGPAVDSEIPPLIRTSQEAFRRELPQLLKSKKRFRQWVAYHGDECLGFAATDTDLYEECFRRGLQEHEFVVRCIVPEVPENLDATPSFDS